MTGETIAAIATAPGPAGIAVVRVSGPDAFAVAERLTGVRPTTRGLRFLDLHFTSGTHSTFGTHSTRIDSALVLSFPSPHSYTGEDVVEFQCHGGTVTPRRVLEACFAAGARLARRGEFTERAFLNGKLSYDQAESVLNLIEAKTDRAADVALDGLAGRRARADRALYEQALAVSTELEHALDVDEGELPPAFFTRIRDSLAALDAALADALKRLGEGRLLREGASVVIAGPPNAGKSSLLNALVGESRAIVSDVPGTTRDAIEAWIDLDGWPVRLIDTAGLRETDDAIEAEGVARAERLIEQAEVVVELRGSATDFTDFRGLGLGERRKDGLASLAPLESLASPQRLDQQKSILINAKCDLARSDSLLNVSAKTGEGLDALKAAIVAALAKRAETAFGSDAQCASFASGIDDAERGAAVYLAARAKLAPFLAAPIDLVLAGNVVRGVAESLGALVGATYSEDLLDRLFSRFCVGK